MSGEERRGERERHVDESGREDKGEGAREKIRVHALLSLSSPSLFSTFTAVLSPFLSPTLA